MASASSSVKLIAYTPERSRLRRTNTPRPVRLAAQDATLSRWRSRVRIPHGSLENQSQNRLPRAVFGAHRHPTAQTTAQMRWPVSVERLRACTGSATRLGRAVPHWRVVVRRSSEPPVKRWPEVWRRARAALCPEADPSCKEPSRQYYVPCHGAGAACHVVRHLGPLLDSRHLPGLPTETPASGRPGHAWVSPSAAVYTGRRNQALRGQS